MKKYLIIIEKTKNGYSSFCPDLPGCVATGKTKATVLRSMRSAIAFHLEGMKDEGIRIPSPKSSSMYLEVKAA
jgi:predicted RNase H-like HicB family nuclease